MLLGQRTAASRLHDNPRARVTSFDMGHPPAKNPVDRQCSRAGGIRGPDRGRTKCGASRDAINNRKGVQHSTHNFAFTLRYLGVKIADRTRGASMAPHTVTAI